MQLLCQLAWSARGVATVVASILQMPPSVRWENKRAHLRRELIGNARHARKVRRHRGSTKAVAQAAPLLLSLQPHACRACPACKSRTIQAELALACVRQYANQKMPQAAPPPCLLQPHASCACHVYEANQSVVSAFEKQALMTVLVAQDATTGGKAGTRIPMLRHATLLMPAGLQQGCSFNALDVDPSGTGQSQATNAHARHKAARHCGAHMATTTVLRQPLC